MKQDIINFFSSLISIILGVVVTFMIQGKIDRLADKKDVLSALELVRSELSKNMDDFTEMTDYLFQERAAAQYFIDHRYDLWKCPKDSVDFHTGILFADAYITTCQDALQLLKMSSLFQKIGNNDLSMKIIRAYDTCENLTENMNRHISSRDARFENSVTEKTVRQYADKGYINIKDYLKTDYGVYVIRKLATQSDPTLTADVTDIQVAIEAIDDYLSLGLKKLKKSKKARNPEATQVPDSTQVPETTQKEITS